MARQPKRPEQSRRPTIAIGVEVSRVTIEFPLVGEATMKVYGRSAGLKPGHADLASVYIEEVLDPKVGRAVMALLEPHLLQKLAAEAAAGRDDGEGAGNG